MEELKARVEDFEQVKSEIESKAGFVEKLNATDIYFDIDGRRVLKIRREKDPDGDFLVRFEPREDGFEKVEETRVENFQDRKQELESSYGVDTVMEKEVYRYNWKGYDILLISFDEKGDFLVVQSENVGVDVFKNFGLENPDLIGVPFSQL